MRELLRCLLISLVSCVICYPISQPVYPNTQYISAQAVPSIAYKQTAAQPQYIQQPQYISQQPAIRPVYEQRAREGLQNYASQPQHQQPVQQVFLSNNADRPGTKAIQPSASLYFQPLQSAVLAAQAREAFAAVQRKGTSETVSAREVQPVQVALPSQPQPQPQQYVRQQPLRYISRPVTAQYSVQQPQQLQPQAQETQQAIRKEPEDYDPNPSYQFGFDVKDDLYTNYQNRKEQRDGNKITGSYSVVDSDGFIRTVSYTADPKEGFKAEVTRQPTDIVVKIPKPDPQFQNIQRPQPQQYIQEVPVQRSRGQQQQRPQSDDLYQYQ